MDKYVYIIRDKLIKNNLNKINHFQFYIFIICKYDNDTLIK